MHHIPNNQQPNVLDTAQAQREGNSLISGQVSMKNDAGNTSNMREGTLISSQNSGRASSPLTFISSPPGTPYDGASGNQGKEGEDPESCLLNSLKPKIVELVKFLLLKYQMKEMTFRREIEYMVIGDEENYYVIFSKASECMNVVFGVDLVDLDPSVHIYVLVPVLGITYDGMLHGIRGIPKTGLLVIVLCVIFMRGNCVREESFWGVLNNIGLSVSRINCLFGEPRKLLTEDFVQEGYLEYRQVPDSDPPCHEFLWGPRAHVETTKMKVLEFFARVTKREPRSYPEKYAEALGEEEERAKTGISHLM